MDEKISIGNGRPIPPPLPHPSEYVVEFDGPEDPEHPYNWKLSAKYAAITL
jgi:DHA1 family multidrug resistance protein-like MFS transporter